MAGYLHQTLVVLLVVAFAISAGSPAVGATEHTTLAFDRPTTTAARGDTATIGLRVPAHRTALVTIRGATNDYEIQTAITDNDGNGRTALTMDTHRAGRAADPRDVFDTTTGDRLEYVTRPHGQRTEPLPSGRYNIIISTASNSIAGVLRLTNGSVEAGSVYTASTTNPTADQVSSGPPWRNEVATGDVAVSRFNVSGIGELIGDPPANDMIRARDSAASARTVHTVRVSPGRNVTLRRLTLDYDAGDGNIPLNVRAGSVNPPTVLGVDTDDDGIIDREVRASNSTVSVSTRFNDGSRFRFDEPVRLAANESLYLRVGMRNPSASGRDDVRLTLNDDIRLDGEITYGTAGSGTLGNGVDFRVLTPNATVVNPVAAVTLDYNDTRTRLQVTQRTARLPRGNYTHRLRLLEPYPYGNTSRAVTTFTTAPPRAEVQSVRRVSATDADTRRVRVRLATNLAPGQKVRISLVEDGTPSKLVVTSVTASQHVTETVTVPAGSNSTYTLRVTYGDVRIAPVVTI